MGLSTAQKYWKLPQMMASGHVHSSNYMFRVTFTTMLVFGVHYQDEALAYPTMVVGIIWTVMFLVTLSTILTKNDRSIVPAPATQFTNIDRDLASKLSISRFLRSGRTSGNIVLLEASHPTERSDCHGRGATSKLQFVTFWGDVVGTCLSTNTPTTNYDDTENYKVVFIILWPE